MIVNGSILSQYGPIYNHLTPRLWRGQKPNFEVVWVYLVYCDVNSRPLHVVAAISKEENRTIIITAYEPNIFEWKEGFRNRRNQ